MSDLTQPVSPSSNHSTSSTHPHDAPSLNVQVSMLSHILNLPLGSTIQVTPKLKEQIDKALDALHFQFKVHQMLKPNAKPAAHKTQRSVKPTPSVSASSSTTTSVPTEVKVWTAEHQHQLQQLWLSNLDLQTIAIRLERSCNTLITKLQKSGHIPDAATAHLARFLARHAQPLIHNQMNRWQQQAQPFGFDPNYRKPSED